MYRSHVLVCGGTGCTSSGSPKIQDAFNQEIEKNGLAEEVKVVQTGCFGLCALGPVVIIYPEGTFYSRVEEKDVAEIVSEHLLKGRLVDRLVYKDADKEIIEEAGKTLSLNDTNFYKTQKRVALRNCGVIDPENIDEYIAMDGYQALGKVLTEMTPDEVIKEIAKRKPYYFVMRDPANSKDGDSLITNFEQIFTTYSPETVRKIL